MMSLRVNINLNIPLELGIICTSKAPFLRKGVAKRQHTKHNRLEIQNRSMPKSPIPTITTAAIISKHKTSTSESYHNEAYDIILELLDTCGFFSKYTNNDSKNDNYQRTDSIRLQLIKSIQKLVDTIASILQKKSQILDQDPYRLIRKPFVHDNQFHDHPETTDTSAIDRCLSELEEILSSIRMDSEQFLSHIHKERAVIETIINNSYHKITKTLTTTAAAATINCINSYKMSFQHQIQLEELHVRKLLKNLDTFYDECFVFDSKNSDKNNNNYNLDDTVPYYIYECMVCLERDDYVNRYDHQELVSIVTSTADDVYVTTSSAIATNMEQWLFKEDESAACIVCEQDDLIVTVPIETVLLQTTPILAYTAFQEHVKDTSRKRHSSTFILVIGSEGSGKTHLCDCLEQQAIHTSELAIKVIRPQLPLDLMGKSVGDVEDFLLSIACEICTSIQPVLLLMDGMEYMIRNENTGKRYSRVANNNSNSNSGVDSQIMLRIESTLLLLMDKIRVISSRTTEFCRDVFAVFTSTHDVGSLSLRFDRTYSLSPPNEDSRKELLQSIFAMDKNQIIDETTVDPSKMKELISDLAIATNGRSYAEIMLNCRRSLEQALLMDDERMQSLSNLYFNALIAMKEKLQVSTPDSLRVGAIDQYADVRITSARDLIAKMNKANSSSTSIEATVFDYTFPMKGESALKAWKAIESLIIVPLCKSKILQDLLYSASGLVNKSLLGGVLLSGPPGSGKSELALQCAICVATVVPSIKLIEVSCTSLVHKEVGGSERAVHSLFESLRNAAPCIVVLDGIETIGSTRGNDTTSEGTMDRVLSTVLVELDGIDNSATNNHCMAVIGITQNSSWIDPALKRPGRLGKVIKLECDWDE